MLQITNKLAFTLLGVVLICTVLSTFAFFYVAQYNPPKLSTPAEGKVMINIVDSQPADFGVSEQTGHVSIKFNEVQQ